VFWGRNPLKNMVVLVGAEGLKYGGLQQIAARAGTASVPSIINETGAAISGPAAQVAGKAAGAALKVAPFISAAGTGSDVLMHSACQDVGAAPGTSAFIPPGAQF
jgi:hypothetical protein